MLFYTYELNSRIYSEDDGDIQKKELSKYKVLIQTVVCLAINTKPHTNMWSTLLLVVSLLVASNQYMVSVSYYKFFE